MGKDFVQLTYWFNLFGLRASLNLKHSSHFQMYLEQDQLAGQPRNFPSSLPPPMDNCLCLIDQLKVEEFQVMKVNEYPDNASQTVADPNSCSGKGFFSQNLLYWLLVLSCYSICILYQCTLLLASCGRVFKYIFSSSFLLVDFKSLALIQRLARPSDEFKQRVKKTKSQQRRAEPSSF